jgi:hypothetical protein
MRVTLALAGLLLPIAVSAQALKTTPPAPTQEVLPPLMMPAPVPDRLPRGLIGGGVPSSMPDVVSPTGIGSSFAGPVNATPFSTTPSSNLPPNAAYPDRWDTIRGGPGGMVPNVSQ